MDTIEKVYDFYNNGAEIGRLESGLGMVEFYRSRKSFLSTFRKIALFMI